MDEDRRRPADGEAVDSSQPRIPRDLAHELRTPLAAVITSLDLITSGDMTLDPSEMTEIVQAAKADAENLLALIESARGQPTEQRETGPTVVGEVVRRVLDRFPAVKVRTHLRVDPTVTTETESGRVDQVITNLVQNVSRYAPDGDVEVRVRGEGSQVVVEVADEGPGIDDPEQVFTEADGGSDQGMHVGLSIARRIAREEGGDLLVADPIRSGATFRLLLPAGDAVEDSSSKRALAPRARILVELANALGQRSLRRMEAGLSRISNDLLGATGACVLVEQPEGFIWPGRGDRVLLAVDDPLLDDLDQAGGVLEVEGEWLLEATGSTTALVLCLDPGSDQAALLLLGVPEGRSLDPDDEVVAALATVAGLSVARTTLGADLATERGLRSSVLEELPIALSIFAGDPPRVVDMNAAERELLGLEDDAERPGELDTSQKAFEVRFADGTPLTVETAPVTQAIRRGERTGPFYLRLRRTDGSERFTRTYCAPFFDGEGNVAGAVVTSEVVDEPEVERDQG